MWHGEIVVKFKYIYYSGNIATRVRAKNEKARKNIVHETSQHFNTLNIHTSTHPSNQDTNNVDNSSETSESQSIDINSIKINTYVPNDCESLPINIDEIAIGRRESETTRKGKQNGTENEELAKVVARREEKWKENVETSV